MDMDLDSSVAIPGTSASVPSSMAAPISLSASSKSNLIATYEPFVPAKPKNRKNRKPLHELALINEFPSLGEVPTPYKSFYLVKSSTGMNLTEIDVISANNQLERQLRGKPKSISELRSGDLLVEVASRSQGEALLSSRVWQVAQYK